MKSWDNEDSIYVFVFHVCKVFVPVVTGKITGTFFWDTLYIQKTILWRLNWGHNHVMGTSNESFFYANSFDVYQLTPWVFQVLYIFL